MGREILRLMNYSCKEAGRTIFSNFHFALEEKEVHGIAGLSNDQRSMLSGFLTGLQDCGSGNLFLYGHQASQGEAGRQRGPLIWRIDPASSLAENMTISENLCSLLPKDKTPYLIRQHVLHDQCRRILKQVFLNLEPDMPVEHLTEYEKLALELVKGMKTDAGIILVSREIRTFSEADTLSLQRILEQITAAGSAVVFLTGSLHQMISLCGRITTVRAGMTVRCFERYEASEPVLRSCILERREISLDEVPDKKDTVIGQFLPEQIAGPDLHGTEPVKLHAGEIVGITDVSYDQLDRLMSSLKEQIDTSASAHKKGLRSDVLFIEELVHPDHFLPTFSVGENILLGSFRESAYPAGILRGKYLRQSVELAAAGAGITDRLDEEMTQNMMLPVQLCRMEISPAYILILSKPFIGLSVSEEESLRQFLLSQAARGKCIIFSTTSYADIDRFCSRWFEIRQQTLAEKRSGM